MMAQQLMFKSLIQDQMNINMTSVRNKVKILEHEKIKTDEEIKEIKQEVEDLKTIEPTKQ